MTKEASYQIDCACAMNLCQNFGRAMARPARLVPPGLHNLLYFQETFLVDKLSNGTNPESRRCVVLSVASGPAEPRIGRAMAQPKF